MPPQCCVSLQHLAGVSLPSPPSDPAHCQLSAEPELLQSRELLSGAAPSQACKLMPTASSLILAKEDVTCWEEGEEGAGASLLPVSVPDLPAREKKSFVPPSLLQSHF